MWIPRTGSDFCLQLCLSLWYGFCHALPVTLVCLFSVLRFFWPKFRPEWLFGHMCTPGVQMTYGFGRIFCQLIEIIFLHSGLTCRALLAEILARLLDFPVRHSILGLFGLNCACYLPFCNSSLHEMSSCSILFYD